MNSPLLRAFVPQGIEPICDIGGFGGAPSRDGDMTAYLDKLPKGENEQVGTRHGVCLRIAIAVSLLLATAGAPIHHICIERGISIYGIYPVGLSGVVRRPNFRV